MSEFIQSLQDTAERFPDRIAVFDHDGARSTSYRELFEHACRVNAWLRSRGLGREDVIGIYYPKGMELIATRIGVIMAGAAWVILEDLMGEDRIRYVIGDCGCKAVFDMESWNEAAAMEPCTQFADPDSHDLAFYIYTSGSTGNPKGAAQEYGIYPNIAEGVFGFFGEHLSHDTPREERRVFRFAHTFPESFVGGVYITVGILSAESTIHVISQELTRDLKSLTDYFIRFRIECVFMTPTFLKAAKSIPGFSLLLGWTGGEIVSGLYSEEFGIVNIYGPSEFGYPAFLFRLDKAYDLTPVGYATCGSDFVLLDENGWDSDMGELCIHLPYFRGYRNLPLQNRRAKAVFKGKTYFRSSDLAKRDPDGRVTILGRIDSMIKINGNRIEPSEAETAIRKTFGLDFCAVKAVSVGGIDVLCAYYTEEGRIDAATAREQLRTALPEYMIPSYFIHLDEIPLNANGKVNRSALPDPDSKAFSVPYAAPQTSLQSCLCKAFLNVFPTAGRIGLDDDFFLLGGDSILAMNLAAREKIEGLTVQVIFQGRTIRRISALLEEAAGRKTEETAEDCVPVNAAQKYMLEYHFQYPGTTMMNLPVKLKLAPGTDIKMAAEAVRQALAAHPAFSSVIEKREDGYYLCRKREMIREIPVEKVSDGALESITADFVQPFVMIGSPLYRCRILSSPGADVILFDVCHVLCDGTSLRLMADEIERALDGKPLREDHCFEILREENEYRCGRQWEEDLSYFERLYDIDGWTTLPPFDHSSPENKDDRLFLPFRHSREKAEALAREYGLGKNGLYIAAAALALSSFAKTADVMLSWTWNGRSDAYRTDAAGVFFKDIPAAFRLDGIRKVGALLRETAVQIREGMAHGSVSYWMEKGSYRGNDLICLIYQGDMHTFRENPRIKEMEELPTGSAACSNALDIEVLDSGTDYGVLLDYNGSLYDKSTMEAFAARLCGLCEKLVREGAAELTLEEILE